MRKAKEDIIVQRETEYATDEELVSNNGKKQYNTR